MAFCSYINLTNIVNLGENGKKPPSQEELILSTLQGKTVLLFLKRFHITIRSPLRRLTSPAKVWYTNSMAFILIIVSN